MTVLLSGAMQSGFYARVHANQHDTTMEPEAKWSLQVCMLCSLITSSTFPHVASQVPT